MLDGIILIMYNCCCSAFDYDRYEMEDGVNVAGEVFNEAQVWIER